MLACKPQSQRAAKPFCGRKVRKGFVPETGSKSKVQYFLGTVVGCPIFHGEVCYRIEYEDGDIEDIAWEELVSIILPEADAPNSILGSGLTDTTNRLSSGPGKKLKGGTAMAAMRMRQTTMLDIFAKSESPGNEQQEKQTQLNGLATPAGEEAQDPSGLGTSGRQHRVTRLGRTRKRDAPDGDAPEEGMPDADALAGAEAHREQSGRRLSPEPIYQEAAADQGVEEAAEERERPPKRRANSDTHAEMEQDNDGDQPAAPPEPEDDPPEGFVARRVGTAGHVAKIHMENFMCHNNFDLDLGLHVNLVSGRNGSGKSAIMQALQVCLGVSARSTGRGTSMASYIRTGARDAKVQVTLWNTGEEAFMPETFGNRITVERVIKAAGAASYALLDERGRKVTFDKGDKPKEVLDRMLDHFALDASNPLTIITQDMARQFLSGGKDDARHKYDMFMAGTLLDTTQDSLKSTNAQLSKMTKNFEESAARYNAEKQTEAQLSSKLQKLKSADEKLRDREMLERAIAWRAVQQMEDRLTAAKAAAQTNGPEMVQLYERHLEAVAQARQELLSRARELEEQMSRHDGIVASHSEHIKSLLKAEKDSRLAMERAKRNKSAAQGDVNQLRSDKQALEERLAKETSGMAAEARRLVEEHQRQVTDKQAAVNEAHEAVNAAHQELEAARSELDKLAQQEQAARRSVQRTQHLLSEHRTQLQQVVANQGNQLAMFHAVELNSLIDHNAHRFRERPIGPIGALLTVTEQRWLLSAEVALSSVFRDYLVSCPTDASVLRELMRHANYQRASVVTTCFTAPPHAIPASRRPANGFVPLLDVLMVNDAAARACVMNYLVDKHRIEGLALASDSSAGRSVNYGGAAGAHITAAIDTDGHFYRRNGGLKWVDRNEKVRRNQCHLMADMSQYMAALQQELEKHEAELGAHHEDLVRLAAELQEARAHEARCNQVAKAAMQRKVRIATELSRAMAAAPIMPRMEEGEEASIVLTQLASIQNDIASSQMNQQNAEEELAIAEQAHGQAVEQATEERKRFQEQVEDGQRLRQVKAEVADKLSSFEAVRSRMVASREEVQSKLAKLRCGVEVAEAQTQKARAAAAEVCSRAEGEQALTETHQFIVGVVAKQLRDRRKRDLADMNEEKLREVQKSSVDAWMEFAGLEKQLSSVNKDIAKVEAEAGCSDLHELEIRLAAQAKLVAAHANEVRHTGDTLRLLQASFVNQTRLFEVLRKGMETLTQNKFMRYMRRRDHEGKLVWNHTERTLTMLIKPKGKNNKDAQTVEDLKQLSGGERSFTTVAFLLAIGANTESPFRCMDEFDVFMDAINRRVATETLLEFALENPAFQYIFLTPQDIQAVEDARQEVMRKRKIQLPAAFLKTVQMRPANSNAAPA